ncbi:hypothetical protein HPB50_010299 [Hyalomma asiaticum]|uniref:Uncharacterized protein n=1 Tax=Hyalomma asiaticum TaxID=266040 RepID=A0ACB7SRP5_HYAAI|nr:hypothetical protein HPB50_010299 [Hyalomma asiaticum]
MPQPHHHLRAHWMRSLAVCVCRSPPAAVRPCSPAGETLQRRFCERTVHIRSRVPARMECSKHNGAVPNKGFSSAASEVCGGRATIDGFRRGARVKDTHPKAPRETRNSPRASCCERYVTRWRRTTAPQDGGERIEPHALQDDYYLSCRSSEFVELESSDGRDVSGRAHGKPSCCNDMYMPLRATDANAVLASSDVHRAEFAIVVSPGGNNGEANTVVSDYTLLCGQ